MEIKWGSFVFMYCNQKNDCNSGCSVQRVCLRPVPGPIGDTGLTCPTGSLGQFICAGLCCFWWRWNLVKSFSNIRKSFKCCST